MQSSVPGFLLSKRAAIAKRVAAKAVKRKPSTKKSVAKVKQKIQAKKIEKTQKSGGLNERNNKRKPQAATDLQKPKKAGSLYATRVTGKPSYGR